MLQLIQDYPLESLLVLSFIATLIFTLVYKFFSNQESIKISKEKTKELQGRIKNEKDPDKIMEINKEMLEASMGNLRHSMKPMLITLPLAIAFLAFLRAAFLPAGVLIPWDFKIPLICANLSPVKGLCDGAGWLVVYALSSLVFSIIIRKVLKIH